MKSSSLKVPADKKDERLDKFLTEKLGLSRSTIQKMIKSGQIKINNETAKVHHFLRENEQIEIAAEAPVKERIEGESVVEPKDLTGDIKILYEDKNLVAINKPAGIAVHPAGGIYEPTVVDWLLKKYPSIKTVGDEPSIRPGIVHRLDKDVSGCLVIAKTQEAFDHLKEQFQTREVKKEYIALVYGKISKDEDEINFPIIRSESGKMAALPEGEEEGREAVTRFDILKRYPQYTLLKVEILTGRTHQIRTHLKAYGHSIVGDKLYATRHQKIKENLPQIFLHAQKLSFNDLNNVRQTVECPLPDVLEEFLKQLP